LLEDTGIAADLIALNGSYVQLPDADGAEQRVRVRVFICGDHMSQIKVLGARGPSSTKDGMEPCPYCPMWPADVADLALVPPAVMEAPRAGAILKMSPLQVPPDAMHGAVNVLHNSVFPRMQELFAERSAGWSATAFNKWMNVNLHLTVDPVAGDALPKVDALARSIDSSKKFLMERVWNGGVKMTVVATLRGACVVGGVRTTQGDAFVRCFRALSTQMDVAYMKAPGVAERARFAAASADLRACLLALECKCTPWVHVWVGHVHQFLERWGTLYYWLGHGLESRHRRLKKEVAASTCG
jgi:hypothetical protein